MFEGVENKIRRTIEGAALGVGLLAGEAAVHEAEAQTSRVEAITYEDSTKALMEHGKRELGKVFEENGNLYVVVEDHSRDMQMAITKAEGLGRLAFGKYMTDKDLVQMSGAGPRIRMEESTPENGRFKGTVLLEMPKPKTE